MGYRLLQCVAVAAVIAAACRTPPAAIPPGGALAGTDGGDAKAIYEIRSYHFEPALLDQYETWVAEEALAYLSERVDVVGFWIETSEPAEVDGAPLDELGSANVTWIIRWPSMKQRHEQMAAITSGPEFEDIFSRVPGGAESYRRTEARFAEAVTPRSRARD